MNSQINTDSISKAWYLIYTKPRAEQVAKQNLERQGYKTYLPLMQTSRRRRGRYCNTVEAMFPRYLFVQLDSQQDNWMPIRSTIGVDNLVRFGTQLAMVPDNLIESFYINETDYGVQERKHVSMQPGDAIEIVQGPMTGLRGVFERLVSNERVALLLELVGKQSRVILSRHEIELIAG